MRCSSLCIFAAFVIISISMGFAGGVTAETLKLFGLGLAVSARRLVGRFQALWKNRRRNIPQGGVGASCRGDHLVVPVHLLGRRTRSSRGSTSTTTRGARSTPRSASWSTSARRSRTSTCCRTSSAQSEVATRQPRVIIASTPCFSSSSLIRRWCLAVDDVADRQHGQGLDLADGGERVQHGGLHLHAQVAPLPSSGGSGSGRGRRTRRWSRSGRRGAVAPCSRGEARRPARPASSSRSGRGARRRCR